MLETDSLKEVHGTFGRLKLSVDGNVYLDGKHKASAKDRSVAIDFLNKGKPVSIATLMILSHRSCKLPLSYISSIVPLYKDGDESNIFASNLEYRYSKPLPHHILPDFYYIPYFNRYGISKTGIIVDFADGISLSQHTVSPRGTARNGYKNARLYDDFGHLKSNQGVHRLLGMVFLEYSADFQSRTINHKDGVGGNNDISNLEWVTRRENNHHAFRTGLNSCGVNAVLCKHLITGTVTRYASFTDAAKALGYKDMASIQHRLTKAQGRVYNDMLAFKLDDGSPWMEYDTTKVDFYRPSTYSIVLLNVFTNSLAVVETLDEAVAYTGVTKMAVLNAIKEERCLPVKGWLFRFKHDYAREKIPTYNKWDLQFFKDKIEALTKFAFVVKNVETGEEQFFTGRDELMAATGIARHQLYLSCDKGEEVKGYIVYRYYPTGSDLIKAGNIYQGPR